METSLLSLLGTYLEVQSTPLCPELRLWLVHGQVDLNGRCEELMTGDYAPYWAFAWGAGQALARYVLDHPEHVRDKRVVDFGAGSGIAGIAAMKAGAREVTAVDLDPKALTFCQRNAALNGVALHVARELPEDWDVLLASDVIYEVFARETLERAAQAGRLLLVCVPGRAGSELVLGTRLQCFDVRCFPDVDYPVSSAFLHRL